MSSELAVPIQWGRGKERPLQGRRLGSWSLHVVVRLVVGLPDLTRVLQSSEA